MFQSSENLCQERRRWIAKAFLISFLPYFILITAGIYGIYYQRSTHGLELLKVRIRHVMQQQQNAMQADLQAIMLDLLILNNHEEMKAFVNNGGRENDQLVKELMSFSRIKKTYDQIRIIDEKGWEIKRIDLSSSGKPFLIAADDLQNKRHTPYFKQAMGLAENEIYMSDFELNREKGKAEIPHKLVIRVATPILDKVGTKKGILVINYLGETILQKYRSLATGLMIGMPLLADDNGNWIVGPNKESSQSHQGDEQRENVPDSVDPDLWLKLATAGDGTIEDKKGLYIFATFESELDKKFQTELSLKNKPEWKVVFFVPRQQLRQMQFDFVSQLLIIYVFSLLLVAFSCFYLTKLRCEKDQTLQFLSERENRIKFLTQFPEKNPHPVLQIDTEGMIVFANSASRELIELVSTEPGAQLPDLWMEKVRTSLRSRSIESVEVLAQNKVFSVLAITNAEPDLVTIYAWEVTEQKRYEEQLLLMASVFENSLEGITITDPDGNIERVNPGFVAITGYSAEEVVGKNPRILKSDRHDEAFYKNMWESIISTGEWHGEIWNRRKGGDVYPEWLSITAIRNYQGDVSHFVAVFHDISELKHNEEKLEFQAFHDALTELPNRILFNDRLETAIAHAKRNEQKLAILFLDLDDFKHVNDSLGHYAGDLLLQEVAKRLKTCSREEDTVARMGGDEFMMIIQDVTDDRIPVEVANRVLKSISEEFVILGNELYLGASIGITIYPLDGEDCETLTKNADLAMYKAKGSGKNNYAFFTPDMHQAAVHRMILEQKLREAIQNNEFVLYYQPKVDAKTARLVGSEALVRWFREDGDIVTPNEFIPLAEQTGLILPLGNYILKESCRQAKIWYDLGYTDFHVAVNLSASQFQDPNLIDQVKEILQDTSLPAHLLNLEITENIVMLDIDTATETISQLSDLGIAISLDDFGTGYSSLSYLKQFSLDVLKIDKSFVKGLPDDADDAAIARMVISLAKNLNLKVVAEGVETKAQLDFLNENQCDRVQGYLFSQPLPAEKLTTLLKQGLILNTNF
ncbi:MAG: EAL domain-containing protein [Proteobacteria bacterium]|nr:EAL domain-containing protein [Pseudomonadota bacterium]